MHDEPKVRQSDDGQPAVLIERDLDGREVELVVAASERDAILWSKDPSIWGRA